MESYEIIWKKVLPVIEIKLSSITYSTYIKGLKPIDLVDKTLVLMTEAQLKADFIMRDTLKSKILDAFQKAKTDVTDIEIFVGTNIEQYQSHRIETDNTPKVESLPIDPNYTFENFVVGNSNRYLYAAAKSVAENPKDIFSMIVGEELEDDIIEDVVLEEAEPKLPELDDLYFEETEVADIEIQLDEPEAKLAEAVVEPEPVAVVNDEIKSVIAKEENKNEEFANTVSDFKDLPKVKNAKSSTYYIQIATVNKKENVAKMIDLHGKKYPVYVIKNPAKSSYQILVGPLNDDEYALVLARFKQTYKDAFLRVAK